MVKSTRTVHPNGTIEYRNAEGKLHRKDGPAIAGANGDMWWYRHGELHREDGPAAEYANGRKVWYRHGKCHREDGPAIEAANGTKEWWVKGVQLTEDEFSARFGSRGTTY